MIIQNIIQFSMIIKKVLVLEKRLLQISYGSLKFSLAMSLHIAQFTIRMKSLEHNYEKSIRVKSYSKIYCID